MSTDINLPKSHVPRFPDRCVVCGLDGPASHVRIVTCSIGWWTWILALFGRPLVVKAPACAACARKLQLRRLFGMFLTIAVAVVSIWFVWPLLKGYVPFGLRKWTVIGLAAVCLSPWIAIELLFAKAFDVTAFAHSVDYEFASKDYAMVFASLNCDADWVKVNGHQLVPNEADGHFNALNTLEPASSDA